jgi:hypothetical protein
MTDQTTTPPPARAPRKRHLLTVQQIEARVSMLKAALAHLQTTRPGWWCVFTANEHAAKEGNVMARIYECQRILGRDRKDGAR